MLSLKQIERIRIKMIKENLSQCELAKKTNCSNTCISLMFKQERDFPKIEKRIMEWYEGK